MSIDFIQSRLANLDAYLNGLDARLQNKFQASDPAKPSFEDYLDKASQEKRVKASIQDDFSKLPANFLDYIKNTSQEISNQYGIEIKPNLVLSIIKQESGFNPNAVSQAGAQGLMQLMPATAKNLGVFNPMNPYQNIKGGINYLAQMMKEFDGNLQKALAAYNAGPKAVEKYSGIPPYSETHNYVENIMKDYLSREDYNSVDIIG